MEKKDKAVEPVRTTVIRMELTSRSSSEVDSVCSDVIRAMKQIGASYSGPIAMPKTKVSGDDGPYYLHKRLIELDADSRVAVWMSTFSVPETVAIRCLVVEKVR